MPLKQFALVPIYPDETSNNIKQLFQSPEAPTTDRNWYPMPETWEDPAGLNHTKIRNYNEICKLREVEKLNPNVERRYWPTQGTLGLVHLGKISINTRRTGYSRTVLVKYHRTSAHHRVDFWVNSEFKIRLTPEHDQQLYALYAQSISTPTNLEDKTLVELALQQESAIITTLQFSKYSSPIFAQRKPNGRLRTIADLRRITTSSSTTTTNRTTQTEQSPMPHNIWLGVSFSASLILPKPTTASQRKRRCPSSHCHLLSELELLLIRDSLKAWIDRYPQLTASYANTVTLQ